MTQEQLSEAIKDLSGIEKCAVLLVTAGPQAASAVLKCMEDDEVEKISVQIAKMTNVTSDVVEAVLMEFRDLGKGKNLMLQGGLAFARDTLAATVGARRAEEIMMRIEAAMEASAFHLLQTLEINQLSSFLQNEHPQTTALILAHLNPRKAAEIISELPVEEQSDVIYRLATMEKASPALLEDVEEVIRKQIAPLTDTDMSAAGGVDAVAMILNNTAKEDEKAILENLTERDSELAIAIKNLMFVFDDLMKVGDRDIQRLLVEVEQRDLALALKGASDELGAKILGNISQRAAEAIREELELMGPVKVSEVEEAQRRIVETAQHLEEQEEITLARGEDEAVML